MTAIMKTVNIGVRIPQEILDKLDRHKGYYSRNRFLCKILDDHVTQLEKHGDVKGEQKGKGVGRPSRSDPTTKVSTYFVNQPATIAGGLTSEE